MSATTTGVPVTDLCPTWCRQQHGALLVPDGEGSDHGAPILDDGSMTVHVTAWVDNRGGHGVAEPSEVYVGVLENDFTPGQVRTLIGALTAALKVIEDEATGVERRAAGALSQRTVRVIRGLLDQQGIPLGVAAARLGFTEDELRTRPAGPLLVSDLYDLALLLGVAPHVLVAEAQAQLDAEAVTP